MKYALTASNKSIPVGNLQNLVWQSRHFDRWKFYIIRKDRMNTSYLQNSYKNKVFLCIVQTYFFRLQIFLSKYNGALVILILNPFPTKGQLISKYLFGTFNSSKKWTKKSTLLLWYLKSNCFCSYLLELKTPFSFSSLKLIILTLFNMIEYMATVLILIMTKLKENKSQPS